jgi:NADPH:quinone reductase-like Zn-dependent oxidoreductase
MTPTWRGRHRLAPVHAVVIHETGAPDVLRVEQVERPQPSDRAVLVRVHAAGINAIDWKFRRGYMDKPLPAILGSDVSGTIEASRAEGFSEGDEVFGLAASGAYAEFAVAQAAVIARKPEGLSHEQAAAIPVAGLTAWQALFDRGGLAAGQTTLIAGAAGGVGHFAVQFARHAGARPVGIGSGRNRDFVLGLGAERYVDYTQEDVAAAISGVDVAFDTVGGETTASLLPTVREGGVLVTIAGAPPEPEARERAVRAEFLVMTPSSERLSRIAELVATGDVRPELSEVLPLTEAYRAHEMMESGHTRGKIILTVRS